MAAPACMHAGAPAGQDAVKQQVKDLNIQFDNLCQVRPRPGPSPTLLILAPGQRGRPTSVEQRHRWRVWEGPPARDAYQAALPPLRKAGARQRLLDGSLPLRSRHGPRAQFLPQDKVVEFAKMQPRELLEATEKALGDSLLYDLHVQLREERAELRQKEAVRAGRGGWGREGLAGAGRVRRAG